MADDVEIYKAILEVEQKGDLKEIAANAKAAETLMAELHGQFKAGVISMGQYASEAKELGAEMLGYRAQLNAVAQAEQDKKDATKQAAVAAREAAADAKQAARDWADAKREASRPVRDNFLETMGITADRAGQASRSVAQLGQAGHDSARGSRNGAMALLEFSRAVEDAQYGIAGVVNNIPGLVMALGGGAGLTAIISLAAVGVAQLVKHWDDLMGMFGSGKIQTEAEHMERLAKAAEEAAKGTGKFTAEEAKLFKQLQNKKREKDDAESERDAMSREQTDDQRALGDAVHKTVIDAGGSERTVSGMAQAESERRKAAGYYRRADGTNDSERQTAERKMLETQVGETLRTAMHSNDTKKQADAVKLLRSFGDQDGSGFAQLLDANDPRKAKAREQAEQKRTREQAAKDLEGDKADAELDRFAEREEKRRQDAQKYVNRFDDGALGAKAEAGKLDVDAVRRAMRRTGASDADVKRLAGETTSILNNRATDRVQQYAADHGMTVPKARAAMAKERGQREAQAIGAGDPLGTDAHADLRGGVSEQLAGLIGAGMNPQQAQAALYRQLMPAIGKAGATSAMAGTLPDAMMKAAINRPDRRSQLLDSAGVADAVQQAVGGGDDTQKKMLQAQLDMKGFMREVVKNTAKAAAPILQK